MKLWNHPTIKNIRDKAILITGWIPLTLRGFIAIPCLLILRQWYGIEKSDLVLMMVATGGLSLIAFTSLVTLLISLWLKFQKTTDSPLLPIETNIPMQTGFVIKTIGFIPFVNLKVDWVSPMGVVCEFTQRYGSLIEKITAKRRCQQETVTRKYICTDIFGLSRVTFEKTFNQPIKILPTAGRLKPFELVRQLSTGDLVSHPLGELLGDRVELRQYVRGDPLKHIIWKMYARTRRLMVREIERAVSPRKKTLLYLVANEQDEPAAATARAVLEQGLLGQQFLFLADGEREPTDQTGVAVEQIIRSASNPLTDATNFVSYVQKGQQKGLNSCVVFAPPKSGKWLDSIAGEAKRRGSQMHVIVGIDGMPMKKKTSNVKKWFVETTPEEYALQDLDTIYKKLALSGAKVSVVDRKSGSVVPWEHLKKI